MLIRKQAKQSYRHEGVITRHVSEYTYEVKVNNQLAMYNQSHMKPMLNCKLGTDTVNQAYDNAGVSDTHKLSIQPQHNEMPETEPEQEPGHTV